MLTERETLLSKSEFLRSLDCVKRLWLDKNRPELRPEHTLASRERMEVGRQIGDFARLRYPNGKFVGKVEDPWTLINKGAECLFEANFTSEGRQARVDVLWKSPAGGWVIDEVKSSTVKDPAKLEKTDKALDLAFQVLTATRAGLDVAAARLILIDGTYVWEGGETLPPVRGLTGPLPITQTSTGREYSQPSLFDEAWDEIQHPQFETRNPYDPERLLAAIDMTLACEKLVPTVEKLAQQTIAALASPTEPAVETNTHCKKCDYFDHCHANSPANDIIHLPRMRADEVVKFRAREWHTIDQIPAEELKDKRLRVRDVIASGKPFISDQLQARLAEIPFPAAFIDYETSNPAFPAYPGTRPYQQVCFQWSAHLMESPDAEPIHHEFLACDTADPRAEFCRSLWEIVKDCPSILHYSGFEISQIKPMVEAGIPLAQELLILLHERTVDLERIVDEHVYYAEFKGRTSIKVVLPVLVPSMSYENLLIGDGMAAAAGFREMINPATSPLRMHELRDALLEYCKQDTLAMVEIYRALRNLAGNR